MMQATFFTKIVTIALVSSLAAMVYFGRVKEGHPFMVRSASASEAQPAKQGTVPLARDPKLAVEEEYQAARRQGTAQALELFIARHPDDALAKRAHTDLQRLHK